MSELNPQEPVPAKPGEPKKEKKGAPTWVWFVGTFAIVSLLGNVVFGGNTWITTSINFVNNTIASLQAGTDSSQDNFCLTGEITEIDKANAYTVIGQAETLVAATTGAIGFASLSDEVEKLAEAIDTVRVSGPEYLKIGEKLLTAKNCNDPTFEYLMADFGNSLVDLSKNFSQWNPESLTTDPALLLTSTPLIDSAASKGTAILTYLETLK
jgi:hypothetical protein